jgi:hypothetical protein
MRNNRLQILILEKEDMPCEIEWCDHEAHYHVCAQADDTEDFHGNLCARHLTSCLQSLVDITEKAWGTGEYPEGEQENGNHRAAETGHIRIRS